MHPAVVIGLLVLHALHNGSALQGAGSHIYAVSVFLKVKNCRFGSPAVSNLMLCHSFFSSRYHLMGARAHTHACTILCAQVPRRVSTTSAATWPIFAKGGSCGSGHIGTSSDSTLSAKQCEDLCVSEGNCTHYCHGTFISHLCTSACVHSLMVQGTRIGTASDTHHARVFQPRTLMA